MVISKWADAEGNPIVEKIEEPEDEKDKDKDKLPDAGQDKKESKE